MATDPDAPAFYPRASRYFARIEPDRPLFQGDVSLHDFRTSQGVTLRIAEAAIRRGGGCGFDHFLNKSLQRRLGRAIPSWARDFERRGCLMREAVGREFGVTDVDFLEIFYAPEIPVLTHGAEIESRYSKGLGSDFRVPGV